MEQNVIIRGCGIYINGEKLPPLPGSLRGYSITQDGANLYVNGYEWKNGKWRRTLRALWNYWF